MMNRAQYSLQLAEYTTTLSVSLPFVAEPSIVADCMSPCSDDEYHNGMQQPQPPMLLTTPLSTVVGKQQLLESVPHHVALVPMQATSISSPERRIIAQKEIIAGEERPKYLLINNQQPDVGGTGNCARVPCIVCDMNFTTRVSHVQIVTILLTYARSVLCFVFV